jgi:MoxR-like ATPase
VLFDEISRCRPDLQNKLFPIVHERKVQGVALERLKHRWAAMNPPPSDTAGPDDFHYAGAEPLDVALADRFAFIVPVPSLAELSRDDQIRVLRRGGETQNLEQAESTLREAVARATALLPSAESELRELAAEYVQVLSATLAQAGHPLSTRRAVQIGRNIVSLRAAFAALGVGNTAGRRKDRSAIEDTFYSATRYSIPDVAWGRPVPGGKILTAHRASWELLTSRADVRAILTETNPSRRIAKALDSDMEGAKVGQVIGDSFAALDRPARFIASAFLIPRLAKRKDLPAATIEGIGHTYSALIRSGEETVTVSRGGADWKRDVLSAWLPGIDRMTGRGRILTNTAIILMKENERFRPASLEATYDEMVSVFGDRRKGGRA